ncbi:MAG: hypothetical protein IT287_08210 [Bdellovibrionaceae bacterium]|nr:hypothetical protein [Pseudobdellovibrionaceae bacterium]
MLISLLFSVLTANAETALTIHRFEAHKNTALVAFEAADEQVKKGDEYFVETPIGNCYLVVKEVMADFFRVDTQQCGSEHIINGKAIFAKEKVVIERQKVTETIQPLPNDSVSIPLDFINEEFFKTYLHERLSVSVSYLAGRNLNGNASLGNQTSIGDFKTSNTIALGADYRIMNLANNFSWTGGFSYNLPRSLGNYTLTTVNGSQTQRLPQDPSLEILSFYTNARYQFNEKLYSYIGMNYIYADISDAPGEISGDFGFHAGARYYALKNFFMDGQINFYNLDYAVGPQVADFSLTELEIKAGYTF